MNNRNIMRLCMVFVAAIFSTSPAIVSSSQAESDELAAAVAGVTIGGDSKYLYQVEKLLAQGVSPNNQVSVFHYKGVTPLHIAALGAISPRVTGHLINALVRYGADVNFKDQSGDTPLVFAIRSNNEAAFRALIENGAKIEGIATSPWKELWNIGAGFDQFELALSLGGYSNQKFEIDHCYGEVSPVAGTALHHLSCESKWLRSEPSISELLIENGANPNALDDEGVSPIVRHLNRWNGPHSANVDFVDRLLKAGARIPSDALVYLIKHKLNNVLEHAIEMQVDLNDSTNGLPISACARHNNHYALKLLLANGAILPVGEDSIEPILYLAAKYSSAALVRDLVKHGVASDVLGMDVTRYYNTGKVVLMSPLHASIIRGDDAIFKEILMGGADVNMLDSDGRSPLDYATGAGRNSFSEVLRRRGAMTGEMVLARKEKAGESDWARLAALTFGALLGGASEMSPQNQLDLLSGVIDESLGIAGSLRTTVSRIQSVDSTRIHLSGQGGAHEPCPAGHYRHLYMNGKNACLRPIGTSHKDLKYPELDVDDPYVAPCIQGDAASQTRTDCMGRNRDNPAPANPSGSVAD